MTVATHAPHARATWHDAFDAQMALWRWTRPGQDGEDWLRESFRENARGLLPNTRDLLSRLYASENMKLLAADPIYVSAEMVEVITAAAESFQPEPLLPTDLLTAQGFLYYEQPFEIPDRFDRIIKIQAVSWAPVVGNIDRWAEGSGDILERFQQTDYSKAWTELKQHHDPEQNNVDGVAITLYEIFKPGDPTLGSYGPPPTKIVPVHVTPWWFGMTFEGNEVDENGKPSGAAWWWKIVQTTFRLMQQQLAVRHPERPDRPTRREATRRGFDDREVVVVRLRREKGAGHDAPAGDANYSHRFIVSGHWRNQWYPASHVHRQIWISPYVKGDESLPLVVRPRRVFTWNR